MPGSRIIKNGELASQIIRSRYPRDLLAGLPHCRGKAIPPKQLGQQADGGSEREQKGFVIVTDECVTFGKPLIDSGPQLLIQRMELRTSNEKSLGEDE